MWLSNRAKEAGWELYYPGKMRDDNQSVINRVVLVAFPPAQAQHKNVQMHYFPELVQIAYYKLITFNWMRTRLVF